MKIINTDLVIVTYNPDIDLLLNLLNSIENQVRNIYIIDNTGKSNSDLVNKKKRKIIYLSDNKGIAYAQNIGLKMALENNADYVMLSDQDTIYPIDYVKNMIKTFNIDNQIAAVAPLFKDINQDRDNEGFIVKNKIFGSKRIFPLKGTYEVFQVIASGKIICSRYLKDIGLMKEELFIDYVDIEWCWRAQKKKYKIIGNANIVITHKLGDNVVKFSKKDITVRSPVRHYYMVRNALYLSLTCESLNVTNRLLLFFRAFYLMLGFSIVSKPHLVHMEFTFKGIIDGLNKRTGKINRNDDD